MTRFARNGSLLAVAGALLIATGIAAGAQAVSTGGGTVAAAGTSADAGSNAIAAAPSTGAASTQAIPDDPTLPKKKTKKTVAAADQPPVALDTGTADIPADPTMKKKKHAAAASADAVPPEPATTASVKKSARKTAAASTDPNAPVSASSPGCRTRSFLVNDYGKDGPTADAKRLLDQDIADWSKANRLQNVKVGDKSVQCEQFLNFVVFDEWTCTASAQVCWK